MQALTTFLLVVIYQHTTATDTNLINQQAVLEVALPTESSYLCRDKTAHNSIICIVQVHA